MGLFLGMRSPFKNVPLELLHKLGTARAEGRTCYLRAKHEAMDHRDGVQCNSDGQRYNRLADEYRSQRVGRATLGP